MSSLDVWCSFQLNPTVWTHGYWKFRPRTCTKRCSGTASTTWSLSQWSSGVQEAVDMEIARVCAWSSCITTRSCASCSMLITSTSWVCPIYLASCTHSPKFFWDVSWISFSPNTQPWWCPYLWKSLWHHLKSSLMHLFKPMPVSPWLLTIVKHPLLQAMLHLQTQQSLAWWIGCGQAQQWSPLERWSNLSTSLNQTTSKRRI